MVEYTVAPGVDVEQRIGELLAGLYRAAERLAAEGRFSFAGSPGGAETKSGELIASKLSPAVPHLAARQGAVSGAFLLSPPCDPRGADWSPAPRVGEAGHEPV